MKSLFLLSALCSAALTSHAACQVVAWGGNRYGEATVPAGLTNVVAIAAGNFHNLALRSDGTVAVWGDRSYGQTNVPAGLSNVVAIAAYGDQCLALKADGRVVGWGSPATPVVVANGLSNIVALAGRNDANLALTADGLVRMWSSSFNSVPPAAQSNVVAIAGGDKQTLVLNADGSVVGWGSWDRGYSGSVTVTVPTNVNNVVALGAGNCQCVALKPEGTLYSWGVNHFGGETNAPQGLTNVSAIAVAHNHGLALRDNGTVVGWGNNLFDNETSVPPTLTNVVMIAAGAGHNLALVGDGSPAVTVHPFAQQVYEGTTAAFTALAVGSPPLFCQWQCNGTNVPDGTATTLLLPERRTGTAENYALVVSNAFGTAVSRAASLTVIPGQVAITRQPASRTNNAGTFATFSVTAMGTPPLQYQWRADGVDLGNGGHVTNAQTATLTLKDVCRSDAGEYSVVITNTFGSVTSQVARLEVIDPAINVQPSFSTLGVSAGQPVSLSVIAGGTPPLAFQWFHAGTPLADGGGVLGASSNALTLNYVLRTNAGDYWVVVTNLYGVVTSQVATLIVDDPAIWSAPQSRLANTGEAVTLSVDARGTPPVTYQWRKDGVDISGATGSDLAFPNLQGTHRGLYNVSVANAFGTVTSDQARLSVNQALPDTFSPASDDVIFRLAQQADGKILVSGRFTSLGGQARTRLGRLNADGSLDTQFNPAWNDEGSCLAVQPDGKILITGPGGVSRLNPDGTPDPSFICEVLGSISSLAVAPDGRIVVGGDLATYDYSWTSKIARMSASGVLDRSFAPVFDDAVLCVALQPDGRILVGGVFGQPRSRLVRLLANGAVDDTFDLGVSTGFAYIAEIILQPDGRILVPGVGRLFNNGALDGTFTIANGFELVSGLALQADGKIILGVPTGNPLPGLMGLGLGRLNSDGTVDPTFDPGVSGSVTAVSVQADGRIVVGGQFSELAGEARTNLGRLLNTDPATSDLFRDGSHVVWLRGGGGPEIWRATFECSTNQAAWVSLGAGARITGGWRVTAASLPTNCTVRARGFIANATASWFVESRLALTDMPPTILTQDGRFGFGTNGFGFDFAGAPGQRVVVQSSADLLNWTARATNMLRSGVPGYFTDPDASNYPARFYRLKSP
ncbi:MAG TPA: immunoglobulin domain-containing protein [Verrucomicrobiae bacterium]